MGRRLRRQSGISSPRGTKKARGIPRREGAQKQSAAGTRKLDITGIEDKLLKDCTPFEQRVYRAVLRIPRGETRSYRWVAVRIGSPRACRAVGQALRRNPFVGIVPCHRVVRLDGGLGGFSRGARRKKKMLRDEGVMV